MWRHIVHIAAARLVCTPVSPFDCVHRATLALAEPRTQANRVALASIVEAQAAYVANGGYASTHVVAEATAFAEACRYLLLFTPKRASRESESAEWNIDGIAAALASCEAWLGTYGSANPNAAPSVKYLVPGSFGR